MAKIPFLKKDKNGNIIILLRKNLYSYSIIRGIVKSVEGVHLKSSLKEYFRIKLETKDFKKGLEFCNYLFSEHR